MTDLTYHQATGLFHHFPGFLSIHDAKHNYLYLNDNFTHWLKQYTQINPLGMNAIELAQQVPDNVAHMLQQCHDASIEYLEVGECVPKIIPFKTPLGTQYYNVLKFKVQIEDKLYIYTTSFDVTKLHQEAKFFEKKAYTDPLTKLHNLAYLSSIQWQEGMCVVVDLDNFKQVNDEMGHSEGDRVLTKFAHCLRRSFSGTDKLIRYGGDEFIILTSTRDDTSLQLALSKLEKTFKQRLNQYQNLAYSVGVSSFHHNLRTTLKQADRNMYHNKHQRKARSINDEI
ncbi:GGDEF domain-containing protein [Vibrio methylphosphonaticus]|uniref:GGDEF domain-containing protein n=1 Tax=Vibrio methylphosphonaticus TaxID=2946866 RepID=UPI00202ABCB1|nr:GGDEF domain-containing protein [Vibrio methylphosphonaticus]MCL9773440.1 GGDEF domain-containing protein [Vibrio methylphosphonaticus]